jgi:hypothetical protein
MNCTEFNNYLNDGIDQEIGDSGAMDVNERAAFNAHRDSCAACQALFASEMRLLESLRAMPVPESAADFADRVLANTFRSAKKRGLSQQQNHHHRQGFMLGFGSAAAAALAIWIVAGLSPDELPGTGNVTPQTVASVEPAQAKATTAKATAKERTQQPVLSIALNTQKKVKLAFASSEPLQGAKITIRLPENVALVGYPGRRQLSWETNLKKGDNLLNLPVIATQVASGELVADIEYAGRVKTLRVNLETMATGAASGNSEFNPYVG